mgnify:CR=1 FL=1
MLLSALSESELLSKCYRYNCRVYLSKFDVRCNIPNPQMFTSELTFNAIVANIQLPYKF